MNSKPILTTSYPRAILHIDADAFFTSVEEALDPSIKGKATVTGAERGIIACANYKAKSMGIKRGIPLYQAKKICPDVMILTSDYEAYSLFSTKMFAIFRRYTPQMEEYSIDEGFLDITGMRSVFNASYEQIANKIRADVKNELGITVSAGLSISKALAKLCSKFRKPDGFTGVQGRFIHILLKNTALEDVWGFGHNTVSLLHKYGLRTAYDFVMMSEHRASTLLNKPGRELWHELRGNSVWPVADRQVKRASIVRSKTFVPASSDHDVIFARLTKNVESAFAKARRLKLAAKRLSIMVRLNDFTQEGTEIRLTRPANSSLEVISLIREALSGMLRKNRHYRSTLIALSDLHDELPEQYDLFEKRAEIDSVRRITSAVEFINERFGSNTIRSGAALWLQGEEENKRDSKPGRRELEMEKESGSRRLRIPRSDIIV